MILANDPADLPAVGPLGYSVRRGRFHAYIRTR